MAFLEKWNQHNLATFLGCFIIKLIGLLTLVGCGQIYSELSIISYPKHSPGIIVKFGCRSSLMVSHPNEIRGPRELPAICNITLNSHKLVTSALCYR